MAQPFMAKGLQEPGLARFLFSDPRTASVWLVIRVYVGWQWLQAGIEKWQSPVWTGSKAGTAMAGFVAGALKKSSGATVDVSGWYAWFLATVVLPHTAQWSYAIATGEVLVGAGLILGLFTGIAAFFGGAMSANYLLAGTVSTNPLLFILATWLVLAWRAAGLIGCDRWALPALGVPGQPGHLLGHRSAIVAQRRRKTTASMG